MKNILLLFALLLLCGCEDNNTEYQNKNLTGNWSLVKNDSTYYEVKVNSSVFQFYNYDVSFLPPRPYRITNDTLFIRFSPNDKSEYDYAISEIDSVNLVLKDNNSDTTWNLSRLDSLEFTFDRILDSEEDLLRFEVSYLNRKNEMFGNNYRYDLDSISKKSKEINIPQVDTLNFGVSDSI